jgi:hypothetical protein
MSADLNLTVPQALSPPPGARNMVMLVLDSLRYDTCLEAAPKNLARIGEIERRYSYATWTAPAHYNLLMGLVPHPEPIPAGMSSPEYLRSEFLRLGEMLQIDTGEIQNHHPPALFVPTFLRTLGYHTRAIVSMPVLNSHSITNRDFESYDRMKRINDMAAMIEQLEFDPARPTFYLLNTGETHFPYIVPGDDVTAWLRRGMSAEHSQAELDELRERQVRATKYIDGLFSTLFNTLPPDTYLVVTSDHGELFGEDGQFGHGPFIHQKVLEVPLVEGIVPGV